MPVHRHPVAAAPNTPHLGAIPLDRGLIERLRSSFEILRPQGQRLGEAFYARLFDAAPHLRSLFRADPAVQAAKLVAALDLIVRNLAEPERNAAMIADLGRRHAGYGARPEHYPIVVELLVASVGEVLGPTASASILGEWRTALELVSRQMVAAAESVERGTRTGATLAPSAAPPPTTPPARP